MVVLSISYIILLVFGLTSWALAISVWRDVKPLMETLDLEVHLNEYKSNASNFESLASDLNSATSAILRSEISVFLLVQWCFSAYAVLALTTIAMFLGGLSTREATRLTERLIKYVIFKVVFCGALIAPDVYDIVLWMSWFAMIGFMRVFLGSAKDRLDTLMQAPSTGWLSYLRPLALVLLIVVHDVCGIIALMSSLDVLSTTKILLCSFDLGIVLVEGLKTMTHYGVNLWERYMASRRSDQDDVVALQSAPAAVAAEGAAAATALSGWEAWEGKGSLLLHMDLVSDIVVHTLTLAHYMHVWFLHGLTFQLIDAILFLDIRSIMVSMFKRIRTYMAYRRATYSLWHAFPDTTASDHDPCAICMERMAIAKQLPCGHLFHLACLRAWLQQSGSESFACPLCRTPLLRGTSSVQADRIRREQRPLLLDAVLQLCSWMYLDLFFALLLGLPLPAPVLNRLTAPTPLAAATRQSNSRRRSRARAVMSLEEEVGESSHPAPAASRPLRQTQVGGVFRVGLSHIGSWLTSLLWRLMWQRRGTTILQAAGYGAEDVVDDGLHDYDDTEEGTEETLLDDMEPNEADILGGIFGDDIVDNDDGGYPVVACSEEGLNHRISQMGWRRSQHGQAGPSQLLSAAAAAAGPSTQDPDDLAGEADATVNHPLLPPPPILPPPYLDPPTWSSSSLENLVHFASNSIHSSLGIGTRGIGTVAGISHETDQEVDSPYRRLNVRALRGRGSERTPPPAASRGGLAAPIPRGSPQEGQQVTVDDRLDQSQLPTREDIKFEDQVGLGDTEGMRGGSAMLSRRTSMRLRRTLD
ncbi:hypothetical protein CEUSTIGMA_g7302.t1 [Chlamydomonas eustigma]|uniref:RING-type domain-containing protein n=1 Tax=Chlamydomonas eustigma TaxID=1157962 RepID=A0A250XAH8_9CHLO|nr:hypothetical protein CEUSTIGMA_g7302.t1 [Chlamydomonas eustigma]|eukprot:GAX79862.1 hypothetical protein CEUSTIGMA_g7302.t1 [Chlamydomonas eustigma]